MAYKTIEKRRAYQNKYYHDNRERLLARHRELLWQGGTYRNTEYHRKYKRKLKRTVLSYYSGGKCVCAICGEDNLYCLSIDHINGKGEEHRKSEGYRNWGGNIYGYLRYENYPLGYQVLCMNCQFIKWAIQRGDVDWSLMTDTHHGRRD